MTRMEDVIRLLRLRCRPKSTDDASSNLAFRYSCVINNLPASPDEISLVRGAAPELIIFWSNTRSASLFVDTHFGQSGLELLDPASVVKLTKKYATERPRDCLPGDLIIGWFRGDSDLLVMRSDADLVDFGKLLIAMPIDARRDWPVVANSLSEFLNKFIFNEGNKYWE